MIADKPKEFMLLGVLLAQWAAEEHVTSSFPEITKSEENDQIYFSFSFGFSPHVPGLKFMAGWDEMNEEYVFDTEEEQLRFSTLEEVKSYFV